MRVLMIAVTISMVVAGCTSKGDGDPSPTTDPEAQAPPFPLFANTTSSGAVGWLFDLHALHGAFDCNVTVQGHGHAEPGAPVIGLAEWIGPDDAAAIDPIYGGVYARVWRAPQSPAVQAGAAGTVVSSAQGQTPWAVDGNEVVTVSGTRNLLVVQFQGLGGEPAGTTASVKFDCANARVDGPRTIAPIGIFAPASSNSGAFASIAAPPGSGNLRIAEANGQVGLEWTAAASLVLGNAGDGHGSGAKHASVESAEGRTDWVFIENSDQAGIRDSTFFALDWVGGTHRLSFDAAGAQVLASQPQVLVFDLSEACPQQASCELPVPPAATPTA